MKKVGLDTTRKFITDTLKGADREKMLAELEKVKDDPVKRSALYWTLRRGTEGYQTKVTEPDTK